MLCYQIRDRWVDMAIGNKLILERKQNPVDYLGFVHYIGTKVISRSPIPLPNLFKSLMVS